MAWRNILKVCQNQACKVVQISLHKKTHAPNCARNWQRSAKCTLFVMDEPPSAPKISYFFHKISGTDIPVFSTGSRNAQWKCYHNILSRLSVSFRTHLNFKMAWFLLWWSTPLLHYDNGVVFQCGGSREGRRYWCKDLRRRSLPVVPRVPTVDQSLPDRHHLVPVRRSAVRPHLRVEDSRKQRAEFHRHVAAGCVGFIYQQRRVGPARYATSSAVVEKTRDASCCYRM